MKNHPAHRHERRFAADPERLRAPGRLELLEIPRVVRLSREDLPIESVLDVGTGTGVFAEAFAAESLRVTGVDPSPALLELAREHAPKAIFQEGTAEHLQFPDDSFDLVFLGHVLHETDDRLRALREALRVAALRVAILEWPWLDEDRGPPLAHRLRPEQILSLAKEAGCRSVERLELAHMHLYRLAP